MTAEAGLSRPLELWAGVECTVNRVGDAYFEQLEMNGHARRLGDLDLFAELGVRTLRYPVLWELVCRTPGAADWTWTDSRLRRLAALGIRPIVGLVHHGSGPRHTHLLDPGFADGLERFAEAVAQRYPWVTDYTPVNEPLTTARFSALYGHWYPHGRTYDGFVRALLNECRATVQAMRAIRRITPQARLIQTEDFGRTYSTPLLAYQATFENQRRLLSFDLLCGLVDRQHPLWSFLRRHGADERELMFFVEANAGPDILGMNYYITSDRWLDEQMEGYPEWSHGGNDRHCYADVEAVRACPEAMPDYPSLLRQLWARYRRPLAITEAHLCGSREEQMRWLLEAWQAAETIRAEGADVRAVTVWALLGAYDWNCLVTVCRGFYEPGAFDVRGPAPRATAVAGMIRALATQGSYSHPVLGLPGWWRRDIRLQYGAVARTPSPPRDEAASRQVTCAEVISSRQRPQLDQPPILILGGTGTLGQAFARLCTRRGLPYRLLARGSMDITDPAAVERALALERPWAVVNAAGYVRVDDAELDCEGCFRANATGPVNLAHACAARRLPLLTFSSDLVFDGTTARPYVEGDTVAPLSVYGASKAAAEREVLEILPTALVVRTSAFFGPWDQHNFITIALDRLRRQELFPAVSTVVVSPTYVPDLVDASLDLLIDQAAGIWHVANQGAVSWADLARDCATRAGLDPALVEDRAPEELGWRAMRPRYSALSSERGLLLPALDAALSRYLDECHP